MDSSGRSLIGTADTFTGFERQLHGISEALRQ